MRAPRSCLLEVLLLGDELRARVGEATFEEEWQRGRAMTLLEAIDQASRNDHGLAPADAPLTADQTTAPSR